MAIFVQNFLGKFCASFLKLFFRVLPPSAPVYIYTTVLSAQPLRALTNYLLRKIIPREMRIPEGVLLLNQDDPVVSGALYLGAYEPYFSLLFRTHIPLGGVVLDIGANLGYYTLIASKNASRVIAYEPEPENGALLERTISANNLTNVTLINSGVGANEEMRTLSLDPDNKGKHTLLESEHTHVKQHVIPMCTIDSSLLREGVSRVDVIKMDIEGWEAYAFMGMTQTLLTHHPILFFEYAPTRIGISGMSPTVMLGTLLSLGYKLYAINESARTTDLIVDLEVFSEEFSGIDSYVNILATVDVVSQPA